MNNNHTFKYGFCQLCGLSYLQRFDPRTCEDIVFKSNTHKWKFDRWSALYGLEYNCEICGVGGVRANHDYIIRIVSRITQFYTCNEWLMLKANE